MRRDECGGCVCKERESGGAGNEHPSLQFEEHLCTGMTSGVAAGTTSGGSWGEGRVTEHVGMKVAPPLCNTTKSPPASLGVDIWLLSYVSSVTWTEKEVLDGEVREQDSQEQLV